MFWRSVERRPPHATLVVDSFAVPFHSESDRYAEQRYCLCFIGPLALNCIVTLRRYIEALKRLETQTRINRNSFRLLLIELDC